MFCLVIKMVLGFLKWLKETSFYEKTKEISIKTRTLQKKEKFILRRKKVYEFFGLRKS